MPKDPNEIGALWTRVSKNNTTYLTGKIDGKDVVIFKNRDKKTDKHPDYRVLLSKPREPKQTEMETGPEHPFQM